MSGKIVGRCGLSPIPSLGGQSENAPELRKTQQEEGIELGYLIGRVFQGKGYAFEACTAILRFAREQLGCKRVSAVIHRENIPSLRLAKKLGFLPCGREAGEYLKFICDL